MERFLSPKILPSSPSGITGSEMHCSGQTPSISAGRIGIGKAHGQKGAVRGYHSGQGFNSQTPREKEYLAFQFEESIGMSNVSHIFAHVISPQLKDMFGARIAKFKFLSRRSSDKPLIVNLR